MSRRKPTPLSQREVPQELLARLREPLVVVLGSPLEVVNLLSAVPTMAATCYQMDLYQANRLEDHLRENDLSARVVPLPDLWDLPPDFQSAVYMPPRGGERELKIDMVDQAYHVLAPRGTFAVWSGYEADPFFPNLLKKVFGKHHVHDLGGDTVVWAQRDGDRPRRRHEVTFQVKVGDGPSCRFVSRPGTFSYGRFDNGSRALADIVDVKRGDRVIDLGCGVGVNGVFAGLQTAPEGSVAFVDSNLRATTLAFHNAKANGLTSYHVYATTTVEGPEDGTFDAALANPPYIAGHSVTRLFVERGKELLKAGGKFYLVTKQPQEMAEILADVFGEFEAVLHRGYTLFIATA